MEAMVLSRIVIAGALLFAQAAEKPADVKGYGPWRLGMSRSEVEAVTEFGPYTPVATTKGLEARNGMFAERKTNISFVFGDHGLRKIQIWAYEGRDENEALAAFYRVYQHLVRFREPVKISGVTLPEPVDLDGLVRAVRGVLSDVPAGREAKLQMGPANPSGTISVFSSLFRHPQFGYYVFLYYQEP